MVATSYQAVSGAGVKGIEELRSQTQAWVRGEKIEPKYFVHQIAFNLLPQVDVFLGSGYTKEEWKIINETRKIMHEPELLISATCVRVPVYVGHSEAVHAEFTKGITPETFTEIVHDAPGITVQDEPSVNVYPTPWSVAGRDDTYVGRIRQDVSLGNMGIAFWLVSDNLRKGAALNAIQIAEELVARGLV